MQIEHLDKSLAIQLRTEKPLTPTFLSQALPSQVSESLTNWSRAQLQFPSKLSDGQRRSGRVLTDDQLVPDRGQGGTKGIASLRHDNSSGHNLLSRLCE
nr:hypothetical protein [Phenylobacterium sp.]